uniref:Uncharacterized protein n=1 Tax=Romanomermis culicivorax TaxID=13658 RepID=A0A915KP35_ROMCU
MITSFLVWVLLKVYVISMRFSEEILALDTTSINSTIVCCTCNGQLSCESMQINISCWSSLRIRISKQGNAFREIHFSSMNHIFILCLFGYLCCIKTCFSVCCNDIAKCNCRDKNRVYRKDICLDCTEPKPWCSRGKCNKLGCNCEGGCRPGQSCTECFKKKPPLNCKT